MAHAKTEGATTSKLLKIKNNPLSLSEPEYIQTFDIFGNIEDDPEEFHEYYQHLAPTRKEQEQHLKHDNSKGIMPEHVHNIDAEFDLRYPKKNAIKLEPHSHICINLKIALEIPTKTIVQLASRSCLAKKGITIRERIIDAGYVGNIMAML
ncbi:hypothetical protein G9A89_014921 [Geosiphon pyriformis]|nr:hypothetical protein G9A89_014921 [Geosiphon pyriformis]